MHIRETRVQAPHETFLAAYDLNIGPPKVRLRIETESVKIRLLQNKCRRGRRGKSEAARPADTKNCPFSFFYQIASSHHVDTHKSRRIQNRLITFI